MTYDNYTAVPNAQRQAQSKRVILDKRLCNKKNEARFASPRTCGTYMLSTHNPPICESPSWIEAKHARFCGSWRWPFTSQKAPEIYQSEKRTKMRRQSGHSGHDFEGAFKNECVWCYFAVRVEMVSILLQKLPLHSKSSCLFVFACWVSSSSRIEQDYPGGTLLISAT